MPNMATQMARDDDLQRLYIFIRDAEDTLQQQGQQRHTETH